MSQYKIKMLVLGEVSTDCYILYREDTKQAVIFDPADDALRIDSAVKELGLQPEAILLTHAHFDHIMAADELRNKYNAKIYCHEEEVEVAANPGMNLTGRFSNGFALFVDEKLKDKEIIELAGFQIQVLHTPGHTKGSACYYLEKEGILFSGDTLFAGSVGRSDFPTGSSAIIIRSVRGTLAALPDETVVYPGHGEQTDIGYEKQHNPFM